MASTTSYLQKKLLDHALGKASYSMPATVYWALYTANPGKAGSQTNEVAGGSYVRQAITTKMSATDLTTGVSTNASDVTFPIPTGNWGNVAYAAVLDASTGGNMLFYGALAAPRSVNSGDVAPNFPAGSIRLAME